MKKSNKTLLIASATTGLILALGACSKTETPTPVEETAPAGTSEIDYTDGIMIANEGSFGAGNGSISFYSPSANTVTNGLFESKNSRPLGDVVQSITRTGSSSYICVNASNKIEVVNSSTFKEEATINNVTQPRYMVINGTTGYVSTWGNSGEISLVDLNTNTVTGAIPVGNGPEKMVINNNNLYVANSGGYDVDSTISVVDLSTNTVTATISIDAYNPAAIVNGEGNTIWVLAKGRTLYDANWAVVGHEPAKLVEINTSNNTITNTTTLFATEHPNNIGISPDRATLYFGGSFGFGAIYTTSAAAPATPTALISETNYGFLVNSSNGNIFLLQEASATNGKLKRYDPAGTMLGEYTVGIFPNGGSNKR